MIDPNQTSTWTPAVQPNWKLRARIWTGVLLLITSAADSLLLRCNYDRDNPMPLMAAVAVLGALGSKLALIGMWRRLTWARYVLAALLVVSIMAFGFGVIYIVGNQLPRPAGLPKKTLVAIALQCGALVPLARSRSLRRQGHPLTAWR